MTRPALTACEIGINLTLGGTRGTKHPEQNLCSVGPFIFLATIGTLPIQVLLITAVRALLAPRALNLSCRRLL